MSVRKEARTALLVMFTSPNSVAKRCSVMQAIQARQPVEYLAADGTWKRFEGLVPDFENKQYRLSGERVGDTVKGGLP